jgi:CAAX protease family protein
MALVWIVGLYVLTLAIAFALGDFGGLYPIELSDGTVNAPALEMVALPLQIAGVLVVTSRLRFNPLDVLALRLPARPGRLILIALGIMAAVFVLWVGFVAFQELLGISDDDVPTDKSQELNEKFIHREGLLLSLLTTGLLAPVQEELLFRGLLLLSFFRTRLWFWGAALLTSVLFAFIHNQFSLNIFLHAPYIFMGIAFAWALRATGSLWAPIFLHVVKNVVAIFMLSAS